MASYKGSAASAAQISADDFKAALIVVDMQEDFCPPNGPLAVEEARGLSPTINSLLALPGFAIRVGTVDFHPENHISFATNHPHPNNKAFESFIDIKNTAQGKEHETESLRLWPVHCVQGTKGASIIPEIDAERFDLLVQKGMDERVEMYSVFADAFGNTDHEKGVSINLEDALHKKGVTDVYVVGVAGDYCVRYTAVDAAKAGFKTWLIEEGTRCVDAETGWRDAKQAFDKVGVKLVQMDGEEIGWVKARG